MHSTSTLQLLRLMADVAALKRDPPSQRQVLIDGLQAIFRTKLGWFCVADNWRATLQPVLQHQVLTSGMNPEWIRYMADFTVNNPVTVDMYGYATLHSDDTTRVWRRSELVQTQGDQQKFAPALELIRKLELGDDAVATYRTGPDGNRLIGFSLHRDVNAEPFTDHERELIRLAIEEIRDLELRGHIQYRDAADTELPPRLAQVLDRLLTGHTPKQIASDLSISVHTIREHMQRLYERYEVDGREALMAKFTR